MYRYIYSYTSADKVVGGIGMCSSVISDENLHVMLHNLNLCTVIIIIIIIIKSYLLFYFCPSHHKHWLSLIFTYAVVDS